MFMVCWAKYSVCLHLTAINNNYKTWLSKNSSQFSRCFWLNSHC